jgi:MFS family permease
MTGINHAPPAHDLQPAGLVNLAAQSAEQIALAAAPIVAVLLLGVGEGQTGALQTALTLPFILFAIPAGLFADRISRRRLMAGAEGLRAAALFAILLLIWLDLLSLSLLSLLGFVAVCGTVAYSVAAPALVPSLVTPQLLPAANARIELARTIAFAGGPALGGVLVGCRRGAGLRLRRGAVGDRSRAAVGHLRAGACAGPAPTSAAGDPGRRPVRAAASAAAAGVHHAVHLQHGFVPAAGGVRALCGAPSRTVGDWRRHHARVYSVGMVAGALLATRGCGVSPSAP